MEYVDIVDENHELIGPASKKVAHTCGLWHYSIHCWIYRLDDENRPYLLLQRRSPTKALFPSALDITAAGHYKAGESEPDGIREIIEELGLNVSFDRLVSLGIRTEVARFEGILNREFCRVYLLREDRRPAEYKPDPKEVDGLVEVRVADGLELFAGDRSTIPAQGVMYDETEGWSDFDGSVSAADFLPRHDPYYYKMFVIADLHAKGYGHYAI